MSSMFQDGDVVLFQGDSITDSGRDRGNRSDLGHGYAAFAAAWFQASHPERQVRFLNRGVGGDRVKDLAARWERDCVELEPNWVSLLVGINDTWRRYDHNEETPVEDFERLYRDLLDRARAASGARLILCEPFVLPTPADREGWREDLDPKIGVVRRLAREYGAIYVPFDGLFAQAAARRAPSFWAADGVHPTPAGHALMAKAWLAAVGEG